MVLPHTHQGAAGTAARWWALALAALGAALVLLEGLRRNGRARPAS